MTSNTLDCSMYNMLITIKSCINNTNEKLHNVPSELVFMVVSMTRDLWSISLTKMLMKY